MHLVLTSVITIDKDHGLSQWLSASNKFSRGERFVYESIPKAEFDEVMQQVERWGLDQHLKERGFEKLIPSAAA